MEDLPTLQGPKNKTMGLEGISPSAVIVSVRERETEQEGLREDIEQEKNLLYTEMVISQYTIMIYKNILNLCI